LMVADIPLEYDPLYFKYLNIATTDILVKYKLELVGMPANLLPFAPKNYDTPALRLNLVRLAQLPIEILGKGYNINGNYAAKGALMAEVFDWSKVPLQAVAVESGIISIPNVFGTQKRDDYDSGQNNISIAYNIQHILKEKAGLKTSAAVAFSGAVKANHSV